MSIGKSGIGDCTVEASLMLKSRMLSAVVMFISIAKYLLFQVTIMADRT